MQTYAAIAAVLLVASQAQAKFDEEASRKNFEECRMETGATETYDDLVLKEVLPTSDNGICLLKCIMEKNKMFNEQGEYDEKAATAYMFNIMEGRPNAKEDIEKIKGFMKECNANVDREGLDKCEVVVKLATCVQAKTRLANIQVLPKPEKSS